MTLEKATEIGKELAHPGVIIDSPDGVKAIKLGSEALKRIVAWRNNNDEDLLWGLPGETEE